MAILSMNDILRNKIIESLEGSEARLVKSIMDLTSDVRVGADKVTIPKVSGLSLETVVPGTRATAGGMTTTGTELSLDQLKQVPEYIDYDDGLNSAVDLKAAFMKESPAIFAQGIELIVASKLATVSANDFESTSATAGAFDIDDIAKAKRLMDAARIPLADRYLACNSLAMEQLGSFDEFVSGIDRLSQKAVEEGIVSRVKGFNIIQSEDIGSTTAASNYISFYHKSAVAFALHEAVKFIDQDNAEMAQTFLSLRSKYGCIDVDNASNLGVRKIKMALTTATS